jgi:hypothetical protein
MRKAPALFALSIGVCATGAPDAFAQEPAEVSAPPSENREPAQQQEPSQGSAPAPEEPAAVAAGAQAPAQGPSPVLMPAAAEPAPSPPTQTPAPPLGPPVQPAPQPAIPAYSTPTQAEQGTVAGGVAAPKGLALGVELGGGMTAGARFPESQAMRSVEEAIDGTFGLSLWLGGRGAVYGLSLERTGLGKDHYATGTSGATMQASFGADTLSLLGRWYFTKERPAFYLGLSLGAALPTVRTTGTRATDFVMPGAPYSCSANGPVGGAASLSAGVEFEVAPGLALLADARAAGFLMSRSNTAFGGCAPGTGPAVGGALRLGVSYRFGI